ncbi:MAG: hypothetical protein WDO73_26005 [Ignavibacteriota bacterium]
MGEPALLGRPKDSVGGTTTFEKLSPFEDVAKVIAAVEFPDEL